MTSPDEESQWQRAYDASIAEQEVRSAAAVRDLDPLWRWSIEFRVGFAIVVTLLGLVGVGIGLIVLGPWYVSVVGVMLLLGGVVATAGAVKSRPWRMH